MEENKKISHWKGLFAILGISTLLITLGVGVAVGISKTTTASTKVVKTLKFATFNISFDRATEGELENQLNSAADDIQANIPEATAIPDQVRNIAEIIQLNQPDVILLNEFNYDENGNGAKAFRRILRAKAYGTSMKSIDYPYQFNAPSNTGIHSGMDLDGNGVNDPNTQGFDYANDSYGFGQFPGKYGMVILSKYPIIEASARTFQKFLWKDMPNVVWPDNPTTVAPQDYYSEDIKKIFRLSSKSHWDVPIDVGNGKVIHVLASHPTPPTYDGVDDHNGIRNHDEIRLFADYIDLEKSGYIYDDNGQLGGLKKDSMFVIMGDQNSDPIDGESNRSIMQLINSPFVNTEMTPIRSGELDDTNTYNPEHLYPNKYDTAIFDDDKRGAIRVDYVLPSKNLKMLSAKVFWPKNDALIAIDPASDAQKAKSSDHRLVMVELEV